MNACVEWSGARTKDGYGNLALGGRTLYAHRVSYERAKGRIPDGMVIDHLCRNPSCVNPAHLEAVTVAENTRRGRRAKLNRVQVAAIRARYANGESRTELGREYGVSRSTIKHITNGRTWRP